MEKKIVIDRLAKARKEIVSLLQSTPENRWHEVFLGKWCLFDVAAHLTGWDIENTKSVDEILQGSLPSCFTYWDDNWVTYNDKLVAMYRKEKKQELLDAMKNAHDAYIKKLDSVSDELFDKDIGLQWHKYTITPAVNADYEAQDEELHAKQIIAWLERNK